MPLCAAVWAKWGHWGSAALWEYGFFQNHHTSNVTKLRWRAFLSSLRNHRPPLYPMDPRNHHELTTVLGRRTSCKLAMVPDGDRVCNGLFDKTSLFSILRSYSSSSSISNVGHERSDSGVMSVGSEGRRGSSTGSPSQPVHLQTLQLKTPQHAATRCRTGTHGVSVHSHGRGLRQRK